MSESTIPDSCHGKKSMSVLNNTSRKFTPAEIQSSPVLLLTVEYPRNGKNIGDFSKSNIHAIQLHENGERTDTTQYSLLQLGDTVLKDGTAYETYEGSIEVDETKLNSGFGPIILIRNEGTTELQCVNSTIPEPKENLSEEALINNLLFTPLPKSVVCTVMPNDGKGNKAALIENSVVTGVTVSKETSLRENVETDCADNSDDETFHVITDKPVACRALASLPANFLYFGEINSQNGKGVFAKIEIPRKARFGPMEGVLVPFDGESSEGGLYFTIETNGMLQKLDVSNENTSNWMRYVRPAESLNEQNLNIHQTGKHLYFSATRKIFPGEELKVWYSASYAQTRNLAMLTRDEVLNNVIDTFQEKECVQEEENNSNFNESFNSNWKCSHCQRVFKSATLFNLHVLTHAADNLEINESCDKLIAPVPEESQDLNSSIKQTLACDHCSETFSSTSNLDNHKRIHSNADTKVYECPICKEVFCKVPVFKEHIHTHATNGIFQCPSCSKTFSLYKNMRGHMRRFHSGKNHECHQCSKKFPTVDKLRTHLLSHTDHKEFTCASCGKQFKRKDKLSVHVKKKCGVKKQSSDKASRKAETYAKYPYSCHMCVLGFKRRGMLVNHFAVRHPNISPESVPELNLPIFKDNKNYYCQYCGKIYKSTAKRKAHIVKNHPGKQLPSTTKTSKLSKNIGDTFSHTVGSITQMPQSCQWCYKQYATKAKLLQHQRKKHPNHLPKSLLHPKRSNNYGLQHEERDPLKDAVEKVTDRDIFLSDPLEFSEYELSVGEGEFIVDATTLKRAIKGDNLPSDCSPEALTELGIIENRPDGYFKVYQGPSGITVAHPVEVWDPLTLCLSPPSTTHLLTSSN